jgi:hypothetical protein
MNAGGELDRRVAAIPSAKSTADPPPATITELNNQASRQYHSGARSTGAWVRSASAVAALVRPARAPTVAELRLGRAGSPIRSASASLGHRPRRASGKW